jgi:hypothetical protein
MDLRIGECTVHSINLPVPSHGVHYLPLCPIMSKLPGQGRDLVPNTLPSVLRKPGNLLHG